MQFRPFKNFTILINVCVLIEEELSKEAPLRHVAIGKETTKIRTRRLVASKTYT